MFVKVCSLRESVMTGRFVFLLKMFFLLSARSAQCPAGRAEFVSDTVTAEG
jgi:hypothetical protein